MNTNTVLTRYMHLGELLELRKDIVPELFRKKLPEIFLVIIDRDSGAMVNLSS